MFTMRICLRIAARANENWFSRSPSTAQRYLSAVTGVKGNYTRIYEMAGIFHKPLEIMVLHKNRLVKLAGNSASGCRRRY
jgi:hypothetical protein